MPFVAGVLLLAGSIVMRRASASRSDMLGTYSITIAAARLYFSLLGCTAVQQYTHGAREGGAAATQHAARKHGHTGLV